MTPQQSPGTLYVVATPIGNLSDLSSRAREVLSSVDLIACEDTRTTRPLLAAHGIGTRTVALHEHNERRAGEKLVASLCAGQSVALVSDAGTPAISDPGALLVEAAHAAGVRVLPIPGPNAAVAAYSASGFAGGQFLFAGFLPASGAARRKALGALETRSAIVFYEAPHRILETVTDMAAAFDPSREIVFARELTKKYEEIARMPLSAAASWIGAGTHRQQGEFVLVLGPEKEAAPKDDGESERVLRILLEDHSVGDAARIAARVTGGSKNALYARAIELAQLTGSKPGKPR